MIFHENRLPADDSHKIAYHILGFFLKNQQNLTLFSAANYRWRFMGLEKMRLYGDTIDYMELEQRINP